MFDDDSNVTFTVSKKTICVVSLFIILLIPFFAPLLKNNISYLDKEAPIIESNVDIYLEAILAAKKSSDLSGNKDFPNIIDQIYQKIINNYSGKLNLSEDELKKTFDNYFSERSKIINNIHDTMTKRELYSDEKESYHEYLDSVNGFSESLSAVACGALSFGLSEVTQERFVKNIVMDQICKNIFIEIVSPVTKILKDRAVIKDVDKITFNMKERICSSISQLATARNKYNFYVEDEQTRTIDPFGNTNIEILKKMRSEQKSQVRADIEAIAIAGFDLDDLSISVQHENRLLSIYLPAPIIISSNIAVEFTGEDSEFLAPKIDHHLYNSVAGKARVMLKERVEKDNLFQRAKENAVLSITNIFQPLMSMPQFNYKVKVYFDNQLITTENNKE